MFLGECFYLYAIAGEKFGKNQCDKVGRFLKNLGEIFSVKSSQNELLLFGLKWKHHSLAKTAVVPFWATFVKTWATFYFNIWSHWTTYLPTYLPTSSFSIFLLFYSSCSVVRARQKILSWDSWNGFLFSSSYFRCFSHDRLRHFVFRKYKIQKRFWHKIWNIELKFIMLFEGLFNFDLSLNTHKAYLPAERKVDRIRTVVLCCLRCDRSTTE